MSASLVGSEMCIRDSRPPPADGTSPRTTQHLKDAEEIAWVLAAQHMAWAVSYTHLTLPTICSV
eukprot:15345841-Alexandrium_andersonii.AAC.1